MGISAARQRPAAFTGNPDVRSPNPLRRASKRKPIKDLFRESRLTQFRAAFSFGLIVMCFCVIAGRFYFLQVVEHEEYRTRSEDNRVKLRPVAPSRGLIFDRNGVLIADNQPAYRLELIPEQVRDVDATLFRLGEIIDLSNSEIERFQQMRQARRRFEAIPISLRLTESEVARFAVNRFRFPGVDVVPYLTRTYPYGADFAHALGYVGAIDANDLQRLDSSKYSGTNHVGKTGIEKQYESLLHGDVGYERVEANAEGRTLRVLERTAPTPGRDLYLTLDIGLQQASRAALGDYTGAVVALDPRTGEVLAMVSNPTFDPNPFVSGVSHEQYAALLNAEDRPLFDRTVRGGYEPGSTFKMYIALAGLESGVLAPDHVAFSGGYFQLPNQPRRYRDWKPGGHGWVDLREAISESVNVYFYKLAVDLGIDRIHSFATQFGFGRTTGLDLPGEAAGILPSRDWKRAQYNTIWYPGETVITGIGQGYLVTTPVQLAHAVGVLASRGLDTTPHLRMKSVNRVSGRSHPYPVDNQQRVISQNIEHWELVINGMIDVVHSKKGTAQAIAKDDPPFRIAGKTGTAQVFGRKLRERGFKPEELERRLRHHALFVSFAPADDPEIALAVVAEHGGSGTTVAAPIARRIIDAWLGPDEPIAGVAL